MGLNSMRDKQVPASLSILVKRMHLPGSYPLAAACLAALSSWDAIVRTSSRDRLDANAVIRCLDLRSENCPSLDGASIAREQLRLCSM